MTKTLQYDCCFCSHSGTVTYDEPEGLTVQFISLVRMLPRKIACDPCGKFERSKRDLGIAIIKLALRHENRSDEDRQLAEPGTRRKLNALLARLSGVYMRRYSIHLNQDPYVIDAILAEPHKAQKVLNRIEHIAREKA